MSNNKITPCLWYDKNAEEAANFYAATFPDSRVKAVHRAPSDYPSGKQGDALTVACGKAALAIDELQPAGGRRMSAGEFVRGHRLPVGARLQ